MPVHKPITLNIALSADDVDSSNISLNHERNRNTLRSNVITEFLKEEPGTGNKDLTSSYIYNVEKIDGEGVIFLSRPAHLNKGFDFVVHVEGMVFGNNKTNPRHSDILDDLTNKLVYLESQGDDVVEWARKDILSMIQKVFYGVETNLIVENFEPTYDLSGLPGMSFEMILKILKWLFIEQDICYWNWSGRNMLMKGLSHTLLGDEVDG